MENLQRPTPQTTTKKYHKRKCCECNRNARHGSYWCSDVCFEISLFK